MENFRKDKFQLWEIVTNESGKQSGSAFCGVLLSLVVSISWIAGIIGIYAHFKLEILEMLFQNTLALGATSALLLGARKIVSGITAKKGTNAE